MHLFQDPHHALERAAHRVLVVDDHPAVRLGLTAIIQAIPGMEVVGEAVDGQDALQQFGERRPNLLTLDMRMPRMDGRETLSRLKAQHASVQVLVVTMCDDEENVFWTLRGGARGYVLKTSPREEIADALRQVAAGQRWIPAVVAQSLASRMSAPSLTPRELEVIEEIRRGHSNKDIGRTLAMSEGTVKSHVREILGKLGAASRTEAVNLAYRRGLLG